MILEDAAIQKGMKTLRRAAVRNAMDGVTSVEEVFLHHFVKLNVIRGEITW